MKLRVTYDDWQAWVHYKKIGWPIDKYIENDLESETWLMMKKKFSEINDLKQYEWPLIQLDCELKKIALKIGTVVNFNSHSRPNRSVTWSEGNIFRNIAISYSGKTNYHIWCSMREDRDKSRYLKRKRIISELLSPFEPDAVIVFFNDVYNEMSNWSKSDLKKV